MGSKLVGRGVFAIAEILGEIIRKGRPLPTVIGFLMGTTLGASVGFVSMYLFGPALGMGAITGTIVAAALFRRPPQLPATDPSLAWGDVRQWWTFQWDKARCLTVIMDRAVYVVNSSPSTWNGAVEQLGQGIRPDLDTGNLIRFSTIDRLEVWPSGPKSLSHELVVVYVARGKARFRTIEFQTTGQRAEFITAMDSLIEVPGFASEEPLERGRAILAPVIAIGAIVVLTALIAWLSAYWISEPPPPPRGETKPDKLVSLLTWAGPTGVLIAGALPLLAALGWLYKRLLYPPQLLVYRWPPAHTDGQESVVASSSQNGSEPPQQPPH